MVSLNVWYDVLFSVNIVSKSLQGKSMEFDNAITLMNGCLSYIKDYRNTGFTSAVINSKEIANLINVPTEFKSTLVHRRKRMFEYES